MKKLVLLACVVSAICLSALGFGQATSIVPSGVTLRIGGNLSIDGSLRDVSKTFIGLGFDYDIKNDIVHNRDTFLSADWFFRSFKFDNGSQFWPVCINERFKGAKALLGKGNAYYFAGIGFCFFDLGESNNRLTGRIGYGQELEGNKVLEIVGYFSNKDRTGATDGSIAVFYGIKF